MGAQLYGRYLDLTVAPLSGGPGLQVKELRVTFDVTKTATSAPNAATVQIYNLNKANRAAVEKKNQTVVLKAGYEDLYGTILVGTLRRVEHSRSGPDIISKLEVRDAGKALYESEFHRSYSAQTQRLAVVRDLVAALTGVVLGKVDADGLEGAVGRRLALAGLARVQLDKVCRAWGVEWSVQDNTAQFLDPSGVLHGGNLAIKLTPTSGLVGSPARTNRGVKCQSLLRPDMLPGSYLVLADTESCNGNFKAQKVHHAGDSWGSGQWLTDAEAIRL